MKSRSVMLHSVKAHLYLRPCSLDVDLIHFVGTKFFLTFYISMRELKIYWGLYLLLHFHYSISLESANTQKGVSFKNLFKKCECVSCYLPISSNLLKNSFRKTSLFVINVTGVNGKTCTVSCIFQAIVVIVMIKILDK